MASKQLLNEKDLAELAKRSRIEAKKKRAQAARDMKVAQTSIFHAEETPGQSLTRLRIRMIEMYSPFTVAGPVYVLKRK